MKRKWIYASHSLRSVSPRSPDSHPCAGHDGAIHVVAAAQDRLSVALSSWKSDPVAIGSCKRPVEALKSLKPLLRTTNTLFFSVKVPSDAVNIPSAIIPQGTRLGRLSKEWQPIGGALNCARVPSFNRKKGCKFGKPKMSSIEAA